MSPRAVLLDADGVMQTNPPGWLDDVTSCVAAADRSRFADDLFASEEAAMAGERPFVEVLREVCGRWGVEAEVDRLVGEWCRVEVSQPMVRLVRELRAAGTPCHLVSNQNDHRAAFLRTECGYADLFDRLFLSCEVGATKADPRFWTQVVEETGVEPSALLVVDDSEQYVGAARDSGLQAVQWTLEDGLPRLRQRLADHDVRLAAGS